MNFKSCSCSTPSSCKEVRLSLLKNGFGQFVGVKLFQTRLCSIAPEYARHEAYIKHIFGSRKNIPDSTGGDGRLPIAYIHFPRSGFIEDGKVQLQFLSSLMQRQQSRLTWWIKMAPNLSLYQMYLKWTGKLF